MVISYLHYTLANCTEAYNCSTDTDGVSKRPSLVVGHSVSSGMYWRVPSRHLQVERSIL